MVHSILFAVFPKLVSGQPGARILGLSLVIGPGLGTGDTEVIQPHSNPVWPGEGNSSIFTKEKSKKVELTIRFNSPTLPKMEVTRPCDLPR
jgi:hypothetical protein